MENKWEEICHLIKIKKSSSEDLFQSEIVNIFEKLGWSRFNKEIEEKRKINIGSANSLKPDIIVKNNSNRKHGVKKAWGQVLRSRIQPNPALKRDVPTARPLALRYRES